MRRRDKSHYLRRFPLPRLGGNCSLYPVWFSISIRLHHITPSPVQCRSQINLSRWCFSGGGLTGPAITHLIEVASDETSGDVDVVPDSQP
ncbi:hypothetical protein P8452_45061 [Trifolium repens]|nr:hypothetical protein QL285_030183 [Trifolium repens]WJX59780.1 hypothetical protein P8452_45061 [Trifolium repens]